MPLTALWAGRLLRAAFAGDSLPAFTGRKVGLGPASGTPPTGTDPGTAITGDPRVGPSQWSAAATAGAVTAIQTLDAFSFTNMPAVPSPGVRWYNVWTSDATPERIAYGQLSADRITQSGDTLVFAAGALSQGMVTTIGSTPTT